MEAEAKKAGMDALQLYRKMVPTMQGETKPSDYEYDMLVCGLHR